MPIGHSKAIWQCKLHNLVANFGINACDAIWRPLWQCFVPNFCFEKLKNCLIFSGNQDCRRRIEGQIVQLKRSQASVFSRNPPGCEKKISALMRSVLMIFEVVSDDNECFRNGALCQMFACGCVPCKKSPRQRLKQLSSVDIWKCVPIWLRYIHIQCW